MLIIARVVTIKVTVPLVCMCGAKRIWRPVLAPDDKQARRVERITRERLSYSPTLSRDDDE